MSPAFLIEELILVKEQDFSQAQQGTAQDKNYFLLNCSIYGLPIFCERYS